MSSRVVIPDDRKLQISDDDWILVKKRLNSGENKKMIKRAGLSVSAGGVRQFDTIEAGTAKCLAYLLDWSLKGPDGKVIVIREQSDRAIEDALDSIDPDSYTEILRAIEAHEVAMETARDAEKNHRDGVKESPAISPSLVGVAGALTGSVS